MRDDIKLVLQVLELGMARIDVIHLRKVDLSLGHLIDHEVQVFLFAVEALEADQEGEPVGKFALVVPVGRLLNHTRVNPLANIMGHLEHA